MGSTITPMSLSILSLKSLKLKFTRLKHKLKINIQYSLLLIQNTSLGTQNNMHSQVHYAHSSKQVYTQQRVLSNPQESHTKSALNNTGSRLSGLNKLNKAHTSGTTLAVYMLLLTALGGSLVYYFPLQLCYRCQWHAISWRQISPNWPFHDFYKCQVLLALLPHCTTWYMPWVLPTLPGCFQSSLSAPPLSRSWVSSGISC